MAKQAMAKPGQTAKDQHWINRFIATGCNRLTGLLQPVATD
jgi:hypothetical protein